MIGLKKMKKRIVRYDTKLYRRIIIYEAVKRYALFAEVAPVNSMDDFCEVIFTSEDTEIDVLIGEFGNYLIQLENRIGIEE